MDVQVKQAQQARSATRNAEEEAGVLNTLNDLICER